MATNEKVGIELVADTRSLRTQLREATQELIRLQQSGTATAAEIAKAGKRAGDLKEQLADARAQIDAFNPEAKFKAFSAVIQGVAGAFSAAQGALALLGVEGEDVQKTLLKVQGALALSEGLNTILSLEDGFKNLSLVVQSSSTFIAANAAVTAVASKVFKLFGLEINATSTAFRVLKGAIAATGIGLLVIALGEAVSAFQSFSNSAQEAKKAQEELNKSIEQGAKTQLEGEKESLRRQGELEVAKARRRGASEAEIFAIQDKFARLGIKAQERYYNEVKNIAKVGDEAEKEITKAKATRDTNLINFQTEQVIKGRAAQEKAAQESLARTAQAEEAWATENEKRLARLFDLQKQGLSETDTKLFELRNQYLQDLQLFSDNEVLKARITQQYEEQRFKIKRESVKKDEKAGEEEFKKFEKRVDKENAQRLKLENMLNKAMTKSIKEQKDQELGITELTEEGKLAIISAAVQTGIRLAGEGTVVGKALGIADATINTYVGASKALATLPPPFSYIAAATTIAQGLMSVNSIINTKVPSGAGVSDTSGGASIPSAPAPIAPRGMEITPTTLDSRSLNTISNVVARAYVVESDITGSQQRIKRIENAARF
jgi:hypothetical protein